MRRQTQPEVEHKMILNLLGLSLPAQPLPRITAAQLPTPDRASEQPVV